MISLHAKDHALLELAAGAVLFSNIPTWQLQLCHQKCIHTPLRAVRYGGITVVPRYFSKSILISKFFLVNDIIVSDITVAKYGCKAHCYSSCELPVYGRE